MDRKPTYSEDMKRFLSSLYHQITEHQRDVIDLFRRSKGEEDGGELATVALLPSCYGVTHPAFTKGRYTEDMQNALQRLQEASEESPDWKELYDYVADYIRRNWLHIPAAGPNGPQH